MTLSSMVVSRDFRGISVLESILNSLHIQVEVEPELGRAKEKLAKSKIDALIVDSDIEGSGSLFDTIQQTEMENWVPLVISNGSELPIQTKFLFRKPISVSQAVRTLSSARNLIVDRRLRYHRQNVKIEASLVSGNRKFDAQILNLSQGGAGLIGDFAKDISSDIQLNFALPHTGQSVNVEGEIVWMKQCARAGIQFKDVSKKVQKQLQIWLEQHYFRR
jgi:hypothetical protein